MTRTLVRLIVRRVPRLWTPAALSAALMVGGCGRPAGTVFQPLDPPLRWPTPPDEPRLEYVGALETEDDLKPRVSMMTGLGRAIFGRGEVRTMLSPMDVATFGSRVFVADSNAQVVHVFDLESRRYERWAPTDEEGGFGQPVAVTTDAAGRALVADAATGEVVVFDASGRVVDRWGYGALARPAGIAFDPAHRRVLVADSEAHAVAVFDETGALLRHFGERGSGPGQFNYPTAVDVNEAGEILVSDSLNFRVQLWSAALEPIAMLGRKGDMPGYFGLPKGAAFAGFGRIVEVDAHFEAVQVFDREGRVLMTFGREGQAPGEFWLPVGAHVDDSGRLWVADSYNRRVQAFRFLEGAER